MKEHVQKVLAMVKAGTITDAQATELIDALQGHHAAVEPGPELGADTQPVARPPRYGERLGLLERVIDAVSGGRTSEVRGVLPSHLNGNDFSMSEVEAIGGADHVFRDNHVRMSHLKDLTLTRTEMIGNDIGTSKVRDLTCRDSVLSGCTIHASSLEDVVLDDAKMTKVHLRASKLFDARLDDSRLEEVAVTASSIKNLGLERGSAWERSRVDASQLHHVATSASTLSDVGFDMARLNNIEVTRSVLRISMVRGYKWADVKLVDCVFEDVMFGAGERSKRSLVRDTTFENCRFDKAIFADTSIVGTTIRNVTLSGVKVVGVHLQGRVIDGNDAFVAAIGGEQALVRP